MQWLKRLNGSRRDSYEEINIPAIQYSLQDVLTFSALSISPVSISTAPDALMATKCLTETLSVPCVFLQTASSQTRPSNIYYHSRMRRLSADRRPALLSLLPHFNLPGFRTLDRVLVALLNPVPDPLSCPEGRSRSRVVEGMFLEQKSSGATGWCQTSVTGLIYLLVRTGWFSWHYKVSWASNQRGFR